MAGFKIAMFRENLAHISQVPFPEGFGVRFFRKGDQALWATVEAAVGEFDTLTDAQTRFNKEFAEELDVFSRRCIFLENAKGEVIGTATAWKGRLASDSEEIGRIHWLAILPEYQGLGLAKPLLSAVMQVIDKYHDQVYLTSQTTSYQAVNLYLNYGFEPFIENDRDLKAWRLLEATLNRQILPH